MMGTLSNGSQASRVESISDIEVVSKPKRRRFPAAEKSRILREADACAAGTIGECLRVKAFTHHNSTLGGASARKVTSIQRRSRIAQPNVLRSKSRNAAFINSRLRIASCIGKSRGSSCLRRSEKKLRGS